MRTGTGTRAVGERLSAGQIAYSRNDLALTTDKPLTTVSEVSG